MATQNTDWSQYIEPDDANSSATAPQATSSNEHDWNQYIEPEESASVPKTTNTQDLGPLNAASNSAVNNVTFGLNKPFNAAGIAAIDYAKNAITGAPHEDYGTLYDKVMQWQKQQDETAEKQHPIASNTGEGIGMAASMGIGASPEVVREAATTVDALKAAAKNNAIIGGITGSINGLGYAQGNAADRIKSGAEGAAIGAGLGATVPAVVQGISKVTGKFISPILSKFTTPNDEQAIQKMAANITRDNIDPANLNQELSNLGENATLADVGGKNTQGLGRTIVGLPGEGKEEATDFLNQRQAQQGSRISDYINSSLGIDKNYYDAEAASIAQQKQAAPLYQQAFSANQNISSPVINRILKTPAGQSALSKAAEFMQNDMSLMGIPDPELAEQAKLVGAYPKGGVSSGLKLRTLDYVKQAMDDQIGALYRSGANKEATSVNSLKNTLLNELDKADKETTGGLYAQGRSLWAGEARAQDALNMGKSFINEDATVTNRYLNNLPEGEKQMFRIGASQAIRDKISNTPYSADAGKNVFGDPSELYGSQSKRDRLRTLFPSQDAFNQFDNQMKAEAKMYATRANITQGSRTAPMAAEMSDAGGVDMGHIIEAAKGNVGGGMIKMGINAAKQLFDKYQFPEEVRNIIAQKLFTNDPAENAKTIAAIQNALQAKPIKMTNRAAFLAGQSGNISGRAVSGQ